MWKVLSVDGPSIMTDKGGISLDPFAYADGGKSQPVDKETARQMRDLFLQAPALLRAAREAVKTLQVVNDTWARLPAERIALAVGQVYEPLAEVVGRLKHITEDGAT